MRLVDPELRAILSALPDLSGLSARSLPQIRAQLAGEPRLCPPGSAIDFAPVEIPGLDGAPDVPALMYRPRGARGHVPAILNIHGGGLVAGDIWREHDTLLALAGELGCAILSVDYRLAPETGWPGPVDDCLAALRWLHDEAAARDIDSARVAVRGVSAGGCLAASLALRVRGDPALAIRLLMLVYPMLDDRTEGAEHLGEHVWTADANAFGWNAYLGAAAADPPPAAVPARAADLAGLPPTFIAVGAIDLFAIEDVAFAGRLIAAGVPTELHVYPGAYHGFNLVAEARVARAFLRDSNQALARAFEEAHR